MSQRAVKLYGPLERSGVVKSHAEFKITRGLFTHCDSAQLPDCITAHSCKAGLMHFKLWCVKTTSPMFLCFQPVIHCMYISIICELYFHCRYTSSTRCSYVGMAIKKRWICQRTKQQQVTSVVHHIIHRFLLGPPFLYIEKVYQRFSKPGGCRKVANMLYTDEHFTASSTHLELHSVFLYSLQGRSKPPDKSSWTAGSSWCCCTPTNSSSSLYCDRKHTTRVRGKRLNPHERAKSAQKFFLTFRVNFGKELSHCKYRCHRWGPGCSRDRCLPGGQSRRSSPQRSRQEESARSPRVASPPGGCGKICSQSW